MGGIIRTQPASTLLPLFLSSPKAICCRLLVVIPEGSAVAFALLVVIPEGSAVAFVVVVVVAVAFGISARL
jgi:hypothetical protein